jgi:two-component system chemotaxis response regulator CheY
MKAVVSLADEMIRRDPRGKDKYGRGYRVLIVDDSMTMRRIVSQHLKSEAFEICGEAANGEDALKMYQQLKPDAVTMDVNMPVLSGIETLKRLLKQDPGAKVVMLTSEGHKDVVCEAINLGAKGYVVKPPSKDVVCQKVRDALISA